MQRNSPRPENEAEKASGTELNTQAILNELRAKRAIRAEIIAVKQQTAAILAEKRRISLQRHALLNHVKYKKKNPQSSLFVTEIHEWQEEFQRRQDSKLKDLAVETKTPRCSSR